MAGSVNQVLLVGRVGRDPAESKAMQGSVTFHLATENHWTSNNGEKKKHTDWHRVRCFGKLADIVRQYVAKGRLVCVEGRVSVFDAEDEHGRRQRVVEVVAESMQLLDSRRAE
jgi:single-strand DNA-binding protein